jgi:putative phosphoesterase
VATKIGLISDVHAQPAPVADALSIFRHEQVDTIICPGDIAGYFDELEPTVELLLEHDCSCVAGNHDLAFIETHADEAESMPYRFLAALPETLRFEIEHRRVYVVHAHPPVSQHGGIKLLDADGKLIAGQKTYWQQELREADYDILIVGHTHQVYAYQLGHVMLINPGSSVFNHSCAILELPSMRVEFFPLGGREILKSWNFSMLFRSNTDYPPAKT